MWNHSALILSLRSLDSKTSAYCFATRGLGLPGWCGAFVLAFVCQSTAVAGVAVDVKISRDQNSASATVSSPAFTTKTGGELLLALVTADTVSSPNTTVQSVTGAGLSWVLVVRSNTQSGTSEIWRAFAPAVLQNVTASARLSQSVVSSITVMSFTGVGQTGSNGSGAVGATGAGHASHGAPTASLITTQNNSLVVGTGNDFDRAVARTPNQGQSIVHQDFSATGDTYWVQQMNATTSAAGTKVTMGDTAPATDQYNLAICEVIPPAAGVSTLTLSPTSLAFGSVTDGSAATKSMTLNSTGTSSLTISSASITGAGLSIVSSNWPVTLAPGHSLTLQVQFAPKTPGTVSGQLTLNSNAASGSKSQVALTGTGVVSTDPQLALSSSSLSFGTVTVGASATKSVNLTSTGTSPVQVTSDAISGSGFSVSGGSFPVALNPQQTLTLTVQFLPKVVGAATGSLTVKSNSTKGSTSTVALSGTGSAVSHSVSLSWIAPGSSADQVVGYHVYRSKSGGSFALLNSSLDTQTAYTDNAVASATTYSYKVKSVDSLGVESTSSNQFTVTIPST